MLRSSARCAGGGSMLDKMMPGYKDKIWSAMPVGLRETLVRRENSSFEGAIKSHMKWQKTMLSYKRYEKSMAPSQKYRKPSVDWRRQMERGTLFYGRWYEGPQGSNYLPGNTVDRLQNVREPFTGAEWAERKEYRSWDLMKLGYGGLALFLLYRATNEWPVVWCEEREEE